jgi:hypothetical protein
MAGHEPSFGIVFGNGVFSRRYYWMTCTSFLTFSSLQSVTVSPGRGNRMKTALGRRPPKSI